MMTLLVPLFYLWLALAILLVAMYFLHRHDLRRNPDDDEHTVPGDREPPTRAVDPEPVSEPEPETEPDPGPEQAEAEIVAAQCRPVMELLRGATLPHGLTPTGDRIADPDRHAILLSPNRDAEQVGTAFADELVRIGFAIEADGLDQARAIRNDQVLMLKICAEAGTRGHGPDRRYPTAAATDVAIEIWTGQDSPPRLTR